MGADQRKTFTGLLDLYGNTLNKAVLPFWKDHLDSEFGGVFDVMDERSEIVSDDKYLWS